MSLGKSHRILSRGICGMEVKSWSEKLKPSVYEAARDGEISALCGLLRKLEITQRSAMLEAKTNEGEQLTTPLIIAARNGNLEAVRVLLKYSANIEARGTVKIDDQIIEDASPLWAASAKGHLDVVKLLVEWGAEVDGRTKTSSTPLRATAYDGRLDIVSYLVEHGADVNARNNFRNTPLMVACYNGHKDVVVYLIKKEAKMDLQDKQGNTVLHYAVERGHFHIVQELINLGAPQLPNIQSLTPLLLSGNDCKVEMVEYFTSRPECTKQERIDGLELLGATIANEPDVYNVSKAYEFMMRGLEERFRDPECILWKAVRAPMKVYQNRRECRTIEDLQSIEGNTHAIHLEGLISRERILGPDNLELRFPIRYRGAVFADSGSFDLCIGLWKHALAIGQRSNQSVTDDLKIFADFFCHMLQRKVTPKLLHIEDVFKYAIIEYKKICEKIRRHSETKELKEDIESVAFRALYFLTIFTKSYDYESEGSFLRDLVHSFLRLQPRTQEGQTLLHLSVWKQTPADEHYVRDVCKYPCLQTTKLLLQAGACANALDSKGNTPLHLASMCQPQSVDLSELKGVLEALIGGGAHGDLVNEEGQTALNVAVADEARKLLKAKQEIKLKCIAARSVKKYKLRYSGVVPKSLESYVNYH